MITFIVASRNEYPHVIWCSYSLADAVPEGEDFEILIMANGNDEKNTELLDWFSRARLAQNGHLRVIWMEELGFWKAMLRGFNEAKGDVVGWICAHSFLTSKTLPPMLDFVRNNDGMVHTPMLWMGDHPKSHGKWKLHSYKHPIKRGWVFHRHSDQPYTVCGSGGGFSLVNKDEWFKLGGGVEPNMTIVGGGEEYMDLKWWLLGSKVWVYPDGLFYHWAKERNWHKDAFNVFIKEEALTNPTSPNIGWNNYIMWNRLIFLWTLGGDEWVQRECSKGLGRYPLWQEYYEQVKILCQPTRDYVLKHQVYDGLTGLLNAEPWDYPKRGGMDGYYPPVDSS